MYITQTIMKSIILILVLGCSFSALAIRQKPENRLSLSSLSHIQKFGVFAASNLIKDNTISNTLAWSDFFDETDPLPYIDYFYVDFRSLLLQSIKVTEEPVLPELDWSYRFDACGSWVCIDYFFTLTSAVTILKGQKQITSVNEVTPNSFTNHFHVPLLQWHSPKFMFNFTDNIMDIQHLNQDLYVALNNMTVITSGNYEYAPELGIQVRNLTIDFSLGYLRSNIENISIVRANGSVEIKDPIKSDVTEDIVGVWSIYKEEYELSTQFRINCLLSAFRSDPRCVFEEDEMTDRNNEYIAENILQFFGNIGLGSMDRR